MAFGALGVIPKQVSSTDPATLQSLIESVFAAQVLATPVSQLVELNLACAGDGAVFLAGIYMSVDEDTLFPNLADQHVRIFWASDSTTLQAKMAQFYVDTDVDRTTFVDNTGGGAGGLWVAIIVYTLADVGDELAAPSEIEGVLDEGVIAERRDTVPDEALRVAKIQRRKERASERRNRAFERDLADTLLIEGESLGDFKSMSSVEDEE